MLWMGAIFYVKYHQNNKIVTWIESSTIQLNYKGFVHHKKISLMYVCIGFPGSVRDTRVLRESSIGKAIEKDGHLKWFYLPENHLIRDSAYSLKTWLMKPYRDCGNLNMTERRHNEALNSARVLIENVFGLLKGRWRILQHVNVYKIEISLMPHWKRTIFPKTKEKECNSRSTMQQLTNKITHMLHLPEHTQSSFVYNVSA